MHVQESLFKIASIFLIAHGMENSVELFASIQLMPPDDGFEVPAALYFGEALSILVGALIWLLSPALARKTSGGHEPISTQSSVAVGCFLLGLYFIGTYLPEIIAVYLKYRSFSRFGDIGASYVQDQMSKIQVLGAQVVIGTLLILFSIRLGKLFSVIRRFGA